MMYFAGLRSQLQSQTMDSNRVRILKDDNNNLTTSSGRGKFDISLIKKERNHTRPAKAPGGEVLVKGKAAITVPVCSQF